MIYIIICQQTDNKCCIYKTIGFTLTESRTICATLIFIFMVLFSILQVERKWSHCHTRMSIILFVVICHTLIKAIFCSYWNKRWGSSIKWRFLRVYCNSTVQHLHSNISLAFSFEQLTVRREG